MTKAKKALQAPLTVPEAATEVGCPLDRFRRLIRRRADLAELLREIGPLRTIGVEDLERVKVIVAEENEKKAKRPKLAKC